ncbi:MAG: GNAT family N-acetyltransferase [Nitrospiraceae bacterium]|nr:GNAT family N-acetyltransferase [Nitrospiraceae bacterium]
MAIELQWARAEDAPDIAALIAELLEEIMAVIGQRAFDVDRARTIELAREGLATGQCRILLARDVGAGATVGLLSLCEGYALYAGGRFGTMPEVYVRPLYRSQGVGARLIREAVRFGRARQWTRLEVNTPPLPAFERSLVFYERQGFSPSGGRKLKLSL